MNALTKTSDFNSLKSIAAHCAEIDGTWHQSLEHLSDEDPQVSAISECGRKLDQMSQHPIRCAGVIFEDIKLDKKKSEPYTFSRLEVSHKDSSQIRTSIRFTPTDEKAARFYLLHARTLWHIELTPASNNILILDNPQKDPICHRLSTEQVARACYQAWNGCFVAATPSKMEVIPIPQAG